MRIYTCDSFCHLESDPPFSRDTTLTDHRGAANRGIRIRVRRICRENAEI